MISILAPSFNEEATIVVFLQKLEEELVKLNDQFHVVILDDCSQDSTLQKLTQFKFAGNNIRFDLLHLKFNVGHQGAIYQGLLYLSHLKPDHVIIMDSDGEDDPKAIPLLLEKKKFEIVEVKRGKRSESLSFKIAYTIYRAIFRFITGKKIDFGNYCLVNSTIIDRVKHTSFVHFAAYLLKQKASRTSIVYNRGKRIDGKSKMGYKGLLLHAFKSMIEFAEDLLLLFFKMFIVILIIFVAVFANIVYQKFIAHTAISGWFSTLSISLIILGMLCFGFFILGILLLNLMHQQNTRSFSEIFSVIKQEKS